MPIPFVVRWVRRKIVASFAAVVAVALVGATVVTAAEMNAVSYKAQVNAICRSNTPRFRQLEADMAAAKRAGDSHRYGYDIGFALSLTLKQGLRVESTPVPVDARAQMASPLRLLHTVDLQLHRVLATVASGDAQAFQAELATLGKISRPLNHSFDAVGLRDCGSNQQ